MALTREQLDALTPPDGWVWEIRPSLRSSGVLARDPAQGLAWNGLDEKFKRLAEWCQANELFAKPQPDHLEYIVRSYDDIRVPVKFKVWANQGSKWERTWGQYTCPMCHVASIRTGQFFCEECGMLRCYSCGVSAVRLHPLPSGRSACVSCTRNCVTKACNNRVANTAAAGTGCLECSPVIFCTACQQVRPKEGARQVEGRRDRRAIPGQKEIQVCATCVKEMTCPECKEFRYDTPIQAVGRKKMCIFCRDKEDEQKRLKFEKFDERELPLGGSMVIPSLPSRPFRTVSVETEVDGDGPYLARTLYRCGLVPFPRVGAYTTYPQVDSEFMAYLKHDGSVSGGELISYLLNLDDPSHADAFLDVMKKLRSLEKLGKIQFNPNCGGHIHVDAHNFGYANVWRLLTGFNYCEDAIYRIAGAGCGYGHRTLDPTHDRANRGQGYANSPVKGPFGTKGELGNRITAQPRMSGLNFQPYLQAVAECHCGAWAYEDGKSCKCNLGKATIEWRVFNSTCNPRILHAWIALIQAFHAWADEDNDPEPEWERVHPPLVWTRWHFGKTSDEHKELVYQRLEWMHTQLPLTSSERDSLCYATEMSDIGSHIDPKRLWAMKELPNVAELVKAKHTRNPARRQRSIVIVEPVPGQEPQQSASDAYIQAAGIVRQDLHMPRLRPPIQAQPRNAAHFRNVPGAPQRPLNRQPEWIVDDDQEV